MPASHHLDQTIPAMPAPSSTHDTSRWEHTRLRRRLLDGTWRTDAEERLLKTFGKSRGANIGDPDLSSNPFSAITFDLACLYDVPPSIEHEDAEAASVVSQLLADAGWSPLMQSVQQQTVGLREMLLRPEVDRAGRCRFRPVTPDMVIATAQPDQPDQIASLRELTLAEVDGDLAWVWEEWTPGGHRVLDTDGDDITRKVYGTASDGFRDAEGGYIPFVLYHALKGAKLWNAWHGRELVDGTLQSAMHWTYAGHAMRNASWPQRYVVGGRIRADGVNGGESFVVTDSTTVVHVEATEDTDGGVQVGQWDVPHDPQKMMDAAAQYAGGLAQFAGISPADFTRLSGDPRSGYALALSREGKRAAARKFEPAAAAADQQLVSLVCRIHNQRTGGALPTTGWRVRYNAVPPTAEERRAHREHVAEMMSLGLMSRAQAYAELHSVTEGEARRQLAAIDADRAPQPVPPPQD